MSITVSKLKYKVITASIHTIKDLEKLLNDNWTVSRADVVDGFVIYILEKREYSKI